MRRNLFLLPALSLILLTGIIALFVTTCVPADSFVGDGMTKKRVTVSRGTFSYREAGSRAGVPVIMVHGWPESSYCWEAVAAGMDSSFRVIAPDLRGLGDSERTLNPSSYRKIELGKDIIAIADDPL